MPDVPAGNLTRGAASLDRVRGETRAPTIGGAEGNNGLTAGKTGWAVAGVIPGTVGGGANNEDRWADARPDVARADVAGAGGAGVARGIGNVAAGVGAAAGAAGVPAKTFITPSTGMLSSGPGARVAGPSSAREDIGTDGVPSVA